MSLKYPLTKEIVDEDPEEIFCLPIQNEEKKYLAQSIRRDHEPFGREEIDYSIAIVLLASEMRVTAEELLKCWAKNREEIKTEAILALKRNHALNKLFPESFEGVFPLRLALAIDERVKGYPVKEKVGDIASRFNAETKALYQGRKSKGLALPDSQAISFLTKWTSKSMDSQLNFVVTGQTGPPHLRVFRVKCLAGEEFLGEGFGSSIKRAKENASQCAIRNLGLVEFDPDQLELSANETLICRMMGASNLHDAVQMASMIEGFSGFFSH